MAKLHFSSAARKYLLKMRALGTDAQGREIFVGLTRSESEEFALLMDREVFADPQRVVELSAKHQAARVELMLAMQDADQMRRKH